MVWRGTSPEGLLVEVERDASGRWVVTVAKAIRSRRHELDLALSEAAGLTIATAWLDELAETISADLRR
jgi:hypothetical protein